MTAEEIEVIEAVNSLALLLEAGGLKHPKHAVILEPLRASVKRIIRKFFRSQRRLVLASVAPHIKHQLTIRRSLPASEAGLASGGGDLHATPPPPPPEQSAKHAARAILPDFVDPLLFSATVNQTEAYDALISQAFTSAAEQIAAEVEFTQILPEDNVSAYIRDNGLDKLTGGLARTTIAQLQDAIADAYLKGGGYEEIVQAIKDTYSGFSDYRAGLIAQTEVNNAYNAGRYKMATEIGYNQKEWEIESGNPCPICIANVANNWIGIAEEFSSGDKAPTAHPACQCGLNFRIHNPGH